jgi:DNA-binding NtrC family response regulator
VSAADIRPLREVEKEAILQAIMITGSAKKAARALGIGIATIYCKMDDYGIAMKINEITFNLRRQKGFPFR